MNITVTGGTGFLGKHLIRALQQAGHKVTNIDIRDSAEYETIIADVRDQEKIAPYVANADAVFHLASLIEAGESVKEPQKFIDYNISGTLSVLEAMRSGSARTFIFSSSAAIYGEPIRVPIQEDDRAIPINPYGMTKQAMEGLLSSYVQAHGFTGVALRYFNLYGPEEQHQPETHAIPRFIKQIFNNEEVTVWGNGEHKRDYIYISDIVTAHSRALEYAQANPKRYHYFNLSTGRGESVLTVIKLIEKLLDKPANIQHFPERAGDPLLLTADPSKAAKELNWQAEIDLESGLQKTVDYFTKYWSK